MPLPSDRALNAATAPDAVEDTTMWSLIGQAVESVPPQIPGVDDEAMRLCMTLHCATSLVFYDLSATLRRADVVAAAPLKLLLILYMYGEMETRDLIRLSGMSRAAASALLDKISGQDMIERRLSERDRRTHVVTLSEKGRTAFVEAFSIYNARERYWAETLTPEERDQLVTLLGKLVNARLDDGNLRRRQ
ncbi:MarR family winged helix-turn-helix transcriptional regulator [Streptosporangium saharense]|uniref:MarR family winged helix-turn-helix transcriptional regulator n=1 Tax=Streptosporangium saharense TaxID=1706840 RepID=UPI0034424111